MEEIREKVRANKLKGAIEDLLAYTKLEQKYLTDVELLSNRYRELKRKEINRIISDQEYKLAYNQLTYDILSLIQLLEDKHHVNPPRKTVKLFLRVAFVAALLVLLFTLSYFNSDQLREENKSDVVKPIVGNELTVEFPDSLSGKVENLITEEEKKSVPKDNHRRIQLDESLPKILQQKLEERAFEIAEIGESGQRVTFVHSGALEPLGDGLFYYPGGQIRIIVGKKSFETGIKLSSTFDLGNDKMFVKQEIDKMIIQAISNDDNIDHISTIIKNNL
jgi:hypothetical protein